MIKLLWANFPKILKRYLFPSTILLSLFSTMLYLFISGQNISLSAQALIQLLIAFTAYSMLVIIIGLFISYNRILYFLYNSRNSLNPLNNPVLKGKNEIVPSNEKKFIPHKFELETLNHNILEYTVFIQRKWYPKDRKSVV